MDQIKDNERSLRDNLQRGQYCDVSVIDIFTAFNVLISKHFDSSSLTDDKYFTFLLGVIHQVSTGKEREFWFENMFRIFEKLSNITPLTPNYSNWLLLQANLIYLAPISKPGLETRFQYS